MILKLKIDVTKIDKTTLFKGAKGVYLDATVLIKDAPDQYGNDGMIVQDVSKEDRLAGNKGPILGNAKWIGKGGKQAPAPVQSRPATTQAEIDAKWEKEDEDEDIPF